MYITFSTFNSVSFINNPRIDGYSCVWAQKPSQSRRWSFFTSRLSFTIRRGSHLAPLHSLTKTLSNLSIHPQEAAPHSPLIHFQISTNSPHSPSTTTSATNPADYYKPRPLLIDPASTTPSSSNKPGKTLLSSIMNRPLFHRSFTTDPTS